MNKEQMHQRFPMKVELHVHLDAAVKPQTILDIAQKRGIELKATTPEALKAEVVMKDTESLDSLLRAFDIFIPVIAGDRDAVYRTMYEFCETCSQQGIKYVEGRYSPHLLANTFAKPHYARESGSFSPRDVVMTVNEALNKGSQDFDITAKSILGCVKHMPEWSMEIANLTKEFFNDGTVAIDICESEFNSGKDLNQNAHKLAYEATVKSGVHRTVHAAEVQDPSTIFEALDELQAERVGHGYRCLDDPRAYSRLRRDDIHLETCPISSLRTGAARNGKLNHPILTFANDGVNFSISTDDPLILGNDLNEDYLMALEFGLSLEQIEQSIFNAARSSFATEKEKKQLLKELDEVYGKH